jgi:hypothetical protein
MSASEDELAGREVRAEALRQEQLEVRLCNCQCGASLDGVFVKGYGGLHWSESKKASFPRVILFCAALMQSVGVAGGCPLCKTTPAVPAVLALQVRENIENYFTLKRQGLQKLKEAQRLLLLVQQPEVSGLEKMQTAPGRLEGRAGGGGGVGGGGLLLADKHAGKVQVSWKSPCVISRTFYAWATCHCCAAAPVRQKLCSMVINMPLQPIFIWRPSGRMLQINVPVHSHHGMAAGGSWTTELQLCGHCNGCSAQSNCCTSCSCTALTCLLRMYTYGCLMQGKGCRDMAPDDNSPYASKFDKSHTTINTSSYVQPAGTSSQQQKTPTPASSPSCPSDCGAMLGRGAEVLRVPQTIYRREIILVCCRQLVTLEVSTAP